MRMTAEETIEIITNAIQSEKMTCEQDKALAIAQKALEKQIPKKPIISEEQHVRYVTTFDCPACNGNFTGFGVAKYCYHCGQAIDWSE